jgi:hypothetical protein
MCAIGSYVDPFKLMLLLVVSIPLLTGLSRIVGFGPTSSWGDDLVDAFVAHLHSRHNGDVHLVCARDGFVGHARS